jgi:hypothetical protein
MRIVIAQLLSFRRSAKADQLIANGDRCLAGQKIRIAEMERRGEDTRPPGRCSSC